MTTKAGQLIVEVIGETRQFIINMREAAAESRKQMGVVSDAVSGIEGAFNLAEKAAAAFGIGLGVSELVSFVQETISSVAQLKTLSAQVGLTTSDFQVMRFEATQLGISQDAMDASVARLTRTIGEAAGGNKTAIDAFTKLGVGVLDSNNKVRPTIDVFRDVADALARIPDPATRAAAETALLGRGAQQMDPLLRQGASALDEARVAAEKFGAVLGPDTIDKIDEMNRQIDEMKLHLHNLAAEAIAGSAAIVNFFATGGGHLAPGVVRPVPGETAAQALARGQAQLALNDNGGQAPSARGHEDQIPQGNASSAASGPGHNPPPSDTVDKVAQEIASLKFEAEQLTRNASDQELYNNLKKAGVDLNSQAGQAIAKYTSQIQGERAEIDEIKKAGEAWDKEVAEAKQIHDSVRTSQEKLNDETERANQLMKDGLLTQEDVNRVASDYNNLLQEAASMHADLMTDEEKNNAALEKATALYKAGVLSAEDYKRELEKLKDGNTDLAQSIDGVVSAFSAAATGAETWQEAMTQAITIVAQEIAKLEFGVGANGSSSGSELEGIFKSLGTAVMGFFGGGSTAGIGTTGPMAGLGGQGALAGFDDGADFIVGGQGGVDRNVVAFRASRGERVRVGNPTDIAPATSGGRAVHVHPGAVVLQIGVDHDTFRRSETQITTGVGRGIKRALARS